MSRSRTAVVAAVLALVLGACSAKPAPAAKASPAGPSCLTGAVVAPASPPPDAAVGAVALKCFAGGGEARVTDLRAPTVVNLWASWCPPCLEELPAVERYAARAAGSVRVVGVVTRDHRDTAQTIIDDKKLTFPMLEDQQQRLLLAVNRNALPVTLFVTAAGQVAYVYNGTALDEASLELMVERYLGVVVPR
jgi:thiol-disulfide isomerase/thioredoxin